MKQLLIDIECFPNYFLLGCKDYTTKETFFFEITDNKDDRKELKEFLASFSGFWISFNGSHYDNVVLAFGQSNNWFLNKSTDECLKELKSFSDTVIQDDEEKSRNKFKYYKWKFTNIDLYLYWSYNLRLSKKISLKGLGIQMGYPVVQELPFDSDTILSPSEIDELRHYNLEHDLGILDMLTLQFEGKGKISLGNLGTIQLRSQIVNDYNINAWSMDGPKIASEVLLKDYCKITKKDPESVRSLRFDRPSFKFKELFSDLNVEFVLSELQKLYNDWSNSRDTFNRTFVTGTKRHPLQVTCGVGGIHSVNKNEIYYSTETHSVMTDDIVLNWHN